MPEAKRDSEFVGDVKNTGPEPTSDADDAAEVVAGRFRLKLGRNGKHLGWFGQTGNGIWACLVSTPGEATTFEWISWDNKQWLKKQFDRYMTWSSFFNTQVAVDNWGHASPWKVEDNHLIAIDSHKLLSGGDKPGDAMHANSSDPFEVAIDPV